MTTKLNRKYVLVDTDVHMNPNVDDIVVDEVLDYTWFDSQKLGLSPFRVVSFELTDELGRKQETDMWLLERMYIIPASELRPLRCDNGRGCECGGSNLAGDADIKVIYVRDAKGHHHELSLCRWGRNDLRNSEADGFIQTFSEYTDLLEWEMQERTIEEQIDGAAEWSTER